MIAITTMSSINVKPDCLRITFYKKKRERRKNKRAGFFDSFIRKNSSFLALLLYLYLYHLGDFLRLPINFTYIPREAILFSIFLGCMGFSRGKKIVIFELRLRE
jgi:hypothetical protein